MGRPSLSVWVSPIASPIQSSACMQKQTWVLDVPPTNHCAPRWHQPGRAGQRSTGHVLRTGTYCIVPGHSSDHHTTSRPGPDAALLGSSRSQWAWRIASTGVDAVGDSTPYSIHGRSEQTPEEQGGRSRRSLRIGGPLSRNGTCPVAAQGGAWQGLNDPALIPIL